jgi:hypothetical protein
MPFHQSHQGSGLPSDVGDHARFRRFLTASVFNFVFLRVLCGQAGFLITAISAITPDSGDS